MITADKKKYWQEFLPISRRKDLGDRIAHNGLSRIIDEGKSACQTGTKEAENHTSFVENERRCCPFWRFGLTVEPNSGPLWLELTGAEGAKEMLEMALR